MCQVVTCHVLYFKFATCLHKVMLCSVNVNKKYIRMYYEVGWMSLHVNNMRRPFKIIYS